MYLSTNLYLAITGTLRVFLLTSWHPHFFIYNIKKSPSLPLVPPFSRLRTQQHRSKMPTGTYFWGHYRTLSTIIFSREPLFSCYYCDTNIKKGSLNDCFRKPSVIQLGLEPRTPTLKVLCSTSWAIESFNCISQLRMQRYTFLVFSQIYFPLFSQFFI